MRLFVLQVLTCIAAHAASADLPHTIEAIKPSVVAVGSMDKTRSPAIVFNGTGFVVADGLTIITNAHVVHATLNTSQPADGPGLGIVVGKGDAVEFRKASLIELDPEHDLAGLRIEGAPLPALKLADSSQVPEGRSVAFTGFPLGMTLGFHHATHRAIISAITPIVMPAMDAKRLDPKMIAQLRRKPFAIFQLDGTAYPGNSGSPVYDPESGEVVGVINMVLVKGLKETAITNPSGIAYAIPSNFIRDLLQGK